MFKSKKEIFKFTGKSHSVKGVLSIALGLFSLLSLITLFIISSISKGNGSLILGAFGTSILVVTFVGFVLGVKACMEKEIYYTAPVMGMIVNGILTIILFLLYVAGIFI